MRSFFGAAVASFVRYVAMTALVVAWMVPPGVGHATELMISVAASLADVVHDLKPVFEASHESMTLRFNVGSSGTLQQQIRRGAPVDVFIAASLEPVIHLHDQGAIASESVRHLATNRLVLIVPVGDDDAGETDWTYLMSGEVKRIAIGNPEHVPAGTYARQALTSLGLWELLSSKLVVAEDVRQVLHYVRIRAVDAGVVYATDAATTPGVKVIAEAPAGSHVPIVYPVARTQSSRYPKEADALIEFLFTDEARDVFARHGFGNPESLSE